MQTSKRIKGLYISLIGVFILSPDSLLIRLLNLNDLSLIFYRGVLPAIATSLLLLIYYLTLNSYYKFHSAQNIILQHYRFHK